MGLYMGAGSRILWSTAFTAIGFGMLETAKGWLGVSDIENGVTCDGAAPAVVSPNLPLPKIREINIFSRHQRTLEHAVSDRYE